MEAAVKKARNGQLVGVVVIVLGIFAGVSMYMMFGQMRELHQKTMQWPEVEGRIIKSEIKPKKKFNRIGRGAAVTTEYAHEWTAEYEVDGRKHSRKWSWDYASDSEASKHKKKRAVGSPVRLHYNPKNPKVCELHRDSSASPMVGAGIGGFLMLVGLIQYAWFSCKLNKLSRRKQEPVDLDDDDYDDVDDDESGLDFSQTTHAAAGMELESMKYFNKTQK